ncbi:hypothetical protein Tco_0882951 [Tanacetum coccineum]
MDSRSLSSAMGSILVNGSPTAEFKFHKGLKQGDPLSPYLFILVMESLHLSFNNIINADLFKGIRFDELLDAISSFLFPDDAVFIGKRISKNNLTIVSYGSNAQFCFGSSNQYLRVNHGIWSPLMRMVSRGS